MALDVHAAVKHTQHDDAILGSEQIGDSAVTSTFAVFEGRFPG
jgi:hypothetical protein